MQISNEFKRLIMMLTIYTIIIVCILCCMLINYQDNNNQDNNISNTKCNTKSNTVSNTTFSPSTTTPTPNVYYFTQPVAPGIHKRSYTNLQRSVLITPNVNNGTVLTPSVDTNKGPVQLTLS